MVNDNSLSQSLSAVPLAPSGLLSLLAVDADSEVFRLSQHAERLRRQRKYAEAISLAESAVRCARSDSRAMGIGLLYLSYARADSDLPQHRKQAIRDCDRAIRALTMSPFNQAIALTVRALIEIYVNTVHGRTEALVYLERARKVLINLRKKSLEHQQRTEITLCDKLLSDIALTTEVILKDLAVNATPATERPGLNLPPARTSLPSGASGPHRRGQEWLANKLTIPTRLLWPESARLPSSQEPLAFSEITIGPQTYQVATIVDDTLQTGLMNVVAGCPYLIVPLQTSAGHLQAIVREQNRPDQQRQYVAVNDPQRDEYWLDQAESQEPYSHIHILGLDRQWVVDNSEADRRFAMPRILGIVEAILIPLTD